MRNSLNEELLKIVPNRFLLAIAAAKRSRQLADGSKSLTGENDETVVLTALNEINEGKVEVTLKEAEIEIAQPVRTKKAAALETAVVAETKEEKSTAKKAKKEEKTSSKDKKKKSVVA
jgi:DNA-directed RNA polymerase omega subunit